MKFAVVLKRIGFSIILKERGLYKWEYKNIKKSTKTVYPTVIGGIRIENEVL